METLEVIETIILPDEVWVSATNTDTNTLDSVFVERNHNSESISRGDAIRMDVDTILWKPLNVSLLDEYKQKEGVPITILRRNKVDRATVVAYAINVYSH